MADDNQEILTDKGRELFLDIAKDIRKNPARYREAGKWLDEYCSEESYWQRQENKLKELQSQKKRFPALLIVQEVEQLEQEIETKRTPALLIRFQEARDNLLEKYEDQQFIPEDDARRIILIVWLLTEPDVEETDAGVTELQKWPWEPIDDVTKMSRGYAQFLFFHGGRIYNPWMKLVRIAWAKLSAEQQKEIPSNGSNPIVGETWTLAGIPIHTKNLISRFKGLKRWKKVVVSVVVVISVLGFVTRALWIPLVVGADSHGTADAESTPKAEAILQSLKEICRDIDDRPLLQKKQTAQSYVGMYVKREPLNLDHISIEDQAFRILAVFPGKEYRPFTGGWGVTFEVDKDEHPELVGAKKGLQLYISGQIEDAGESYVQLSDVSLSFD